VADLAASASERAVSFGPFRLLPAQRLLLEGDKPVRLGSRALDILIALVERPGEVVGKEELMARVWPDTLVEEGNLKFQIGGLRRALGDGHGGNRYIATIPGRGYSFVSVARHTEEALPAELQTAPTRRLHNLPASLTRLVGRAETVSKLAEQLRLHRLLTIVGTGGIGKTSLALARRSADRGLRAWGLADRSCAARQFSPGAERRRFRDRDGDPLRRPGARPSCPAQR
jgi:DNA-binding winged helix-turn-helix (wHTH) protein